MFSNLYKDFNTNSLILMMLMASAPRPPRISLCFVERFQRTAMIPTTIINLMVLGASAPRPAQDFVNLLKLFLFVVLDFIIVY